MTRVLRASQLLLWLAATPLCSQATGWVHADDPLLPIFEHLVLRGDVDDPSPQIRPFRLAEARAVLERSECTSGTSCAAIVRLLLAAWRDVKGPTGVRADVRAGIQAYTDARRNPLWPDGGGDKLQPYAEAAFRARAGVVGVGARGVMESRVNDDPDWTGPRDGIPAFRLADAWASVETPHSSVRLGHGTRNWGPVGVAGLAIGDAAYARPDFTIELRNRFARLSLLVAPLDDAVDADGVQRSRWFASHRLAITPFGGLTLGLWETLVASGRGRSVHSAIEGLIGVFAFRQQFGRPDDRNAIIGIDASWRVAAGLLLEGQLAVDDYRLRASDTARGERDRPDRYAYTLQAGGGLGEASSWTARYARVSSLAYRTFRPAEGFVYRDVGLARIFPDNDVATVEVGIPVASGVLIRPEVSLLRQGEGRIQAPFPSHDDSLAATPGFLIGTVRKTVRIGIRSVARVGRLTVVGQLGVSRTANADHVTGRRRDRFDGRILVTIGAAGTRSTP